jgi:hypothetical protein
MAAKIQLFLASRGKKGRNCLKSEGYFTQDPLPANTGANRLTMTTNSSEPNQTTQASMILYNNT